MTDPSASRRYNEKEVALIIKQASELQEANPGDSTSGMSLVELEQIARETGLDPALIRRAAADLDTRVTDRTPSRFLGAPTTLRLERTIDGEISSDEYEAIVLEIQRAVGGMGSASTLGRSLQWTSAGTGRRRLSGRLVQVTVTPKNGRTTIRIEEPMGQVARALFAASMGGIGMGMMPLVSVGGGYLGTTLAGPGGAAAAAIAVGAGFLGATYLFARTVFNRIVSSRGETLQTLMSRLAEHVSATATKQPKE
ncbi:MAG: hypothetical protein ABIT20_03895 [Gemmatimonadaceae bacterium]